MEGKSLKLIKNRRSRQEILKVHWELCQPSMDGIYCLKILEILIGFIHILQPITMIWFILRDENRLYLIGRFVITNNNEYWYFRLRMRAVPLLYKVDIKKIRGRNVAR